jgi:hypothetical protein
MALGNPSSGVAETYANRFRVSSWNSDPVPAFALFQIRSRPTVMRLLTRLPPGWVQHSHLVTFSEQKLGGVALDTAGPRW